MNEPGVDTTRTDHSDTITQILRLCLQSRWDREALDIVQRRAERDDVDWNALLQLSRREGVAALLYHTTGNRGLLPTSTEEKLRVDYLTTAARNMRLFYQLEGILKHLAEHRIPVILLKGAALAKEVYPTIAVRPMNDVDVLVREGDVPPTLRTLNAMGYETVAPTAYRCEVTARKPGSEKSPVEVHWSLFVSFYYQQRIPMDWLWETTKQIEMGKTTASVLGPEAQLLHLCGHLHLHHGGDESRLLWLHDVAALLVRYEDQIDWADLLNRCQQYDLVLPVRRTLRCMVNEWRAPIPPRALQSFLEMEASQREKRVLARLTETESPAAGRFWTDLAEVPGRRKRLAVALRNVFPPPGYIEQIHRVPHPLLIPFAYPYHWWLALRRAAG